MQEEIWKPIPNFPRYMVSNIGRVKSIDFIIEYADGRVRHNKEKIRKLTYHNGYTIIRLFKRGDFKGELIRVHRLVAEAFIPNPDNKPFIDHINTIRDDNRVENLRWVTSKENSNNPITIERNRQIGLERMSNPKNRAKISKSIQEKYKDPKWRQMVLEANRKEDVRIKRQQNGTHKNVLHFDEQGNFIERFVSTCEASRQTGISQTAISKYCRTGFRPQNKHIWKYE